MTKTKTKRIITVYVKLQSKKLYFQIKLKQYENNIKNKWKIMKVIIGKSKILTKNKLPTRKPLLKNSTVVL